MRSKATRVRWSALILIVTTLAITSGLATELAAAWTTVGNGFEYQAFTTAEPNDLFVTRMDRGNPNATIDTTIAYDQMSGAREVMSAQAARQDGALTWWGGSWGATNDVVCAINGGFFNMTTGLIDGGQIQSGWYAHWFPDMGSFSGFAWKTDRTAFHGECIDHTAANVYVKFTASGNTMAIDGVNRTPGSSDLVIFTPQWDNQTPSGTRTEVVVQMNSPTITTTGTGHTTGTIISEAGSTGTTWIPFDCIVLSAAGSDGSALANYASVGATVEVYQQLVEKNEPTVQGTGACATNTGVNWANVFASINTNYHFLENGVVRVPDAVTHPGYIGYVNLNPRTAICWNSTYVFFVICDGRSTRSKGMSCARLGEWARDTLGATDGVNLDGGGSSEMIVNGSIMNRVSDGSERAVCNGVVMVNVVPKQQTTTFGVGQTVTVTSAANIRLGPGTNYGLRGSATAGQTGTVQTHSLNGVYAKGYNWWRVNIGGVVGWIGESLLSGGAVGPPVITQQPAAQTPGTGGTAVFTVAASGTGTLSYKWQKNSVDLSNTGHYSGVLTTILTISPCDASDVASYRCVVTNSYGSTTSDSATLTLGTPPAAPTAQPATNVGTSSITWNWGTVSGATGYKLWTAATGGTQIGGTLTTNSYTESGLQASTPYTRYVEAWNACCASTTRTQLGPTSTATRNCMENPGFENGFQLGVGTGWTSIHVGTGGDATFTDNTTYHNSGAHCQAIQISGSSAKDSCGYVYQKLNVTPGRTYAMIGGFLTSNNNALHGRFGYDPTAGTDPFGPSAIIDDFVPSTSPPFNMRPHTVTATAEYLTIFVGGYYSPKTGSAIVYVDDIWMKPAAPTSSTGTLSVCNGQTVTITADGGFDGLSSELHWYYGPNGTGGSAGVGTSLVVGPITTNRTYYPRWESSSDCGSGGNTCCISDDGPSVTLTVSAPPTAVSVTDEGSYTPSQDALKASWTASTSSCGIDRYEYAVGTSSSTQNIRGWTSNGASASATISGLSLVDGTTYYVQARAVDLGGNMSAPAAANGILAAQGVTPISSAWSKTNDAPPFSLRNKVVTAKIGSAFWLEEIDRSSAMRVVSPASVIKGNTISVAGVLKGDGVSRYLLGDVVINAGGSTIIQPLGVTCKWLGGSMFNSSTPGVAGGQGQYNIGLLVRCWGNVTYYNTSDPQNKYFYLNDGSGLSSGGHDGVKVWCGAVEPPTTGTAIATGVISTESIGGQVVPILMIRDAVDIRLP